MITSTITWRGSKLTKRELQDFLDEATGDPDAVITVKVAEAHPMEPGSTRQITLSMDGRR